MDIMQGSFINNWLGGVLAENGIRSVMNVNCENSGPICVDVPYSAAQTMIFGVNMASDGTVQGTCTNGCGVATYTIRYNGPAGNIYPPKSQLPAWNWAAFYNVSVPGGGVVAP